MKCLQKSRAPLWLTSFNKMLRSYVHLLEFHVIFNGTVSLLTSFLPLRDNALFGHPDVIISPTNWLYQKQKWHFEDRMQISSLPPQAVEGLVLKLHMERSWDSRVSYWLWLMPMRVRNFSQLSFIRALELLHTWVWMEGWWRPWITVVPFQGWVSSRDKAWSRSLIHHPHLMWCH